MVERIPALYISVLFRKERAGFLRTVVTYLEALVTLYIMLRI